MTQQIQQQSVDIILILFCMNDSLYQLFEIQIIIW